MSLSWEMCQAVMVMMLMMSGCRGNDDYDVKLSW